MGQKTLIRLRVDLTNAQLLAEKLLASNKWKRTHAFCDTGAVLYQLRYEANRELVTWRVRNIAVDGEECKGINERSYILNTEKDMKTSITITVM